MHMCVEKSWLPCQGFTWTEDDHSRDAKHRLPHDLLNVNERHGKHQQAGYIDVASTLTSRKDTTPHCPSSSRFIQEHFPLQCRNRNPRTTPGHALNTLLTPPNHPSHITAVHWFTASDNTSGELTRYGVCAVQVAGGAQTRSSHLYKRLISKHVASLLNSKITNKMDKVFLNIGKCFHRNMKRW